MNTVNFIERINILVHKIAFPALKNSELQFVYYLLGGYAVFWNRFRVGVLA